MKPPRSTPPTTPDRSPNPPAGRKPAERLGARAIVPSAKDNKAIGVEAELQIMLKTFFWAVRPAATSDEAVRQYSEGLGSHLSDLSSKTSRALEIGARLVTETDTDYSLALEAFKHLVAVTSTARDHFAKPPTHAQERLLEKYWHLRDLIGTLEAKKKEQPQQAEKKLPEPRSTPSPDTVEAEAQKLADRLQGLPEVERTRILATIASSVGLKARFAQRVAGPAKPPAKAPALWSERDENSGLTSISFLRTHYAAWLPKIISISEIGDLDPPLYLALMQWANRHTIPKDLAHFFTSTRRRSSEAVEKELKELKIVEPADAYKRFPRDKKRAKRLYNAALRRL